MEERLGVNGRQLFDEMRYNGRTFGSEWEAAI